jgi:hypothetical protein
MTEILENYRHPELLHSSGVSMELDIFIPKEQLAFEYQGAHHYYDVYALGSGWNQQNRDKEKRETCKDKGITLIEIPYWWDKTLTSLKTTINHARQNLVYNNSRHLTPTPVQELPSGIYSPFQLIGQKEYHQ